MKNILTYTALMKSRKMNSRWKVYNTRLICSFITILIVLISINVLVNPFEIFNIPKIKRFNFIKPDKERNQRITKIVSLKPETRFNP